MRSLFSLAVTSAVVGALATAPSALASVTITSRFAQLLVTDQACANAQAVCDRHLDPPIDSGTGPGPLMFDHAITQPHASASADGDEAHADASGHYAVSITGGGASGLAVTTSGSLSGSAGVTAVSGQQTFAQGTANAQASVSFTLDAPVQYPTRRDAAPRPRRIKAARR